MHFIRLILYNSAITTYHKIIGDKFNGHQRKWQNFKHYNDYSYLIIIAITRFSFEIMDETERLIKLLPSYLKKCFHEYILAVQDS